VRFWVKCAVFAEKVRGGCVLNGTSSCRRDQRDGFVPLVRENDHSTFNTRAAVLGWAMSAGHRRGAPGGRLHGGWVPERWKRWSGACFGEFALISHVFRKFRAFFPKSCIFPEFFEIRGFVRLSSQSDPAVSLALGYPGGVDMLILGVFGCFSTAASHHCVAVVGKCSKMSGCPLFEIFVTFRSSFDL